MKQKLLVDAILFSIGYETEGRKLIKIDAIRYK